MNFFFFHFRAFTCVHREFSRYFRYLIVVFHIFAWVPGCVGYSAREGVFPRSAREGVFLRCMIVSCFQSSWFNTSDVEIKVPLYGNQGLSRFPFYLCHTFNFPVWFLLLWRIQSRLPLQISEVTLLGHALHIYWQHLSAVKSKKYLQGEGLLHSAHLQPYTFVNLTAIVDSA